jgi:hypothetical protein
MNTVTESIYNGKIVTIPMADVQHIEAINEYGITIITKHTRWDVEIGTWANGIWIDAAEAAAFRSAWCRYRSELESETLADLSPREDREPRTAAGSLD